MNKFFIAWWTTLIAMTAQAEELPLQLVGSILMTEGGDKFYVGNYDTGEKYKITAGGDYALNVGANYSVTPDFDLQITLGLHSSGTHGSNGNIDFTRYPLEMLGLMHLSDVWRLGLGARSALSAKTTSSGVAASLGSFYFKPSVGSVVELQYLMNHQPGSRDKAAFIIRLVNESYTEKTTGLQFSGNHVGIGFAFYK